MCLIDIPDQFGIVRRIKGGDWVKTKHRGWIKHDTYLDYLSYAFDPVIIKWVIYKYGFIVNSGSIK